MTSTISRREKARPAAPEPPPVRARPTAVSAGWWRALPIFTAAILGGCELPPAVSRLDLAVVDAAPSPDLGEPLPSLPQLTGNQLPIPNGAQLGRLSFVVTDGDTGRPVPSRVVFRPVPAAGFADSITSGSFDPTSWGGATGAVIGPGVLGSPEGVLLMEGRGVVPVPAGDYRLFITRGPEYEAVETSVTVAANKTQNVSAELVRSVDTRGWLSADLHVHMNRSPDSRLPGDRRVMAMVANDVKIMVNTDHNINTELAPSDVGLDYDGSLIGTIVGNEFNFSAGHGGAYPVPYDSLAPNGGSTTWQAPDPRTKTCLPPIVGINCMDPARGFEVVHQLIPGQTVVTLNHAYWPGTDLGYFSNVHWGAGTSGGLGPLSIAGAFDAIELLNGYRLQGSVIDPLIADWFYLLAQGFRITAVAGSDTHRINWTRAGYPRVWLRLPIDRPGDITGALFSDAIRHQRATLSTGPFLTITADGAQIGDTVVPRRSGEVKIGLFLDAPGWMTVDFVQVYVNGVVAARLQVPPRRRPLIDTTFTLPLDGDDAWIVAIASGDDPLPGDVVGEYSSRNGYQVLPFAVTNPIFIDANADNVWNPPPLAAPPANAGPEPAPDLSQLLVPPDCEPLPPGAPEPNGPIPHPEQELMPLLY